MAGVNVLAVVLAALSAFLLGGLWYSLLFAKQWAALTGQSEDRLKSGNPAIVFGGAFLLNLVAAFVLALFVGPLVGVGLPGAPYLLAAFLMAATAVLVVRSATTLRSPAAARPS